MTWDQEIDCSGLLCPLPVLKARKRLLGMMPGQILRVIATDRMAEVDLPHFCREAGHDFLSAEDAGPARAYLVRRGPAA